jgi:hypothetical protein
MFTTRNTKTPRRVVRDSGHLLLAVLLLMALMIISATYEAPRIVQQLKRDREEEMIHRGTEYARAIKKYYKKFGQYPMTLEQLENTNNIRFLRKRYKDPLAKDGKWTMLHYGDIAMMLNASAPGVSAASLASGGQGANGSPAGQQSNSPFSSSGFGSSSNTPTTSGGFGTSNFGSSGSQSSGGSQGGVFGQPQAQQASSSSSGFGSSSSSTSSSTGSGFFSSGSSSSGSGFGASSATSGSSSSSGFGSSSSGSLGGSGSAAGSSAALNSGSQSATGQTFGAGAIVGVSSVSKDPTIRIYNKKKTYNEWQFIYNPQMDQQNVLLRGPYSPSTLISNTNIGTPAGQVNQQNQQQSPFGQSPFGQSSGFGNQQPSGFGSSQQTSGAQPSTSNQP